MKKVICAALLALLLPLTAFAAGKNAPVNQNPPPESPETPAEGTLPTYDLTFPEDMPLAAKNFVLTARAQFELHPFEKLPKANDYTKWYYEDKREIGWCSVFQIWCAYHSGLKLIRFKGSEQLPEGTVFSAMEGRVGQVYETFNKQGRWRDAQEGAVPKPGWLLIYGVRGSTGYTHVGIVESVTPLGGSMYELTTVEGNINSTIKRMNYRYDAQPKDQYRNMSVIPEAEITRTNCQYTLQKSTWYINGFCATWE